MARTKNNQKNNNGAKLGFEETLWQAADKQRGHMDAAEYKHVVLGLIFLKYISDAFSEVYNILANQPYADHLEQSRTLATIRDTIERIVYDQVKLIDFTNPENNDWLVVNQFTVIEDKKERRPDVVVFINGLPLAVIELKNPTAENATIKSAFNQLQTYKNDIRSLFPYNEILIVSDATEARVGTLTADWERFMPWRENLTPQPPFPCREGGKFKASLLLGERNGSEVF